MDRSRVGIAGHSAGAVSASIVQGLEPWPTGGDNPVGAVVAWDNLGSSDAIAARRSERAAEDLATLLETVPDGDVEPRAPAMGQTGDYFLTPRPHAEPPDPDARSVGFEAWRSADVPAYQLVVRGGTHYEWSRTPTFPATSWGFGNALADHYTVAWFDGWLKAPGEPGYRDADDRLLADDEWGDHLSFHYCSKRAFCGRDGREHVCGNVRAGCGDAASGRRRSWGSVQRSVSESQKALAFSAPATRCRSRERSSLVMTNDASRLSNHAPRSLRSLWCPRAALLRERAKGACGSLAAYVVGGRRVGGR